MSSNVPRLRMFAGPNGSGKSTIKDDLPPELPLGFYVNADEIEKLIRANAFFDLRVFDIETTADEILSFFCDSAFLADAGLLPQARRLAFDDGKLIFADLEINSYFASVLCDFIRRKLLENGISFTFETVMSSDDKVKFLREAQERGFRTYLYYVSTEHPRINIGRVKYRVSTGGHPVPEDKIISRYHRSLSLLFEAVKYSNRAYLFDNSYSGRVLVAKATDGDELEMQTGDMPIWFKQALWDKFEAEEPGDSL